MSEILRSRDHDIEQLQIALRKERAEIKRLRAALNAITKVSRDDWEFRDGQPVPKWRLLAADAITIEQSTNKGAPRPPGEAGQTNATQPPASPNNSGQ